MKANIKRMVAGKSQDSNATDSFSVVLSAK